MQRIHPLVITMSFAAVTGLASTGLSSCHAADNAAPTTSAPSSTASAPGGLASTVATNTSIQLTLPPFLYAVPGVEMNLYFDNVVLTQTPEKYRFEVNADLGTTEKIRWTVTPTAQQVGDHPLVVAVSDDKGNILESARTTLRVVPADAGAGRNIRLLMVGASHTMASRYPNRIAELLDKPGNPTWTMMGTHQPTAALPRVYHEGYGGWTWERFSTAYEPNAAKEPHPEKNQKRTTSPFVFGDATGKPMLDVERYFNELQGGQRPDFVTFLLGVNDMFPVDPENSEAIEKGLDEMLKHADTLIAAFQRAAPKADIGVCLTMPPNSRESGFIANYQGKYHRWGWKRIQSRLVQRLIEHFKGREKERIFIVPTEVNIDVTAGFPVDNAVHPNRAGYSQMGDSIYAWLKWRLSERTDLASAAATSAQ
jgi:lysophospholipase L1-like esterase